MNLYENERCEIIHQESDVMIKTDRPVEYGGKGRSFSSTDLVSAALGSCILTTLEPIFERDGYNPQELELTIVKELSQKPKMIKSFEIQITYPEEILDVFMKKVTRAIETCPVKRSLGEKVEIDIRFIRSNN